MVSTADENDDEADLLRFTLQVSFVHQTVTAKEISAGLERDADRAWTAGDRRTTLIGRPLHGIHKKTYWTYWRTIRGKRAFFDELMTALSALLEKRNFIEGFVRSGGEATFLIALPGDQNIGDVLTPKQLKQIGEAGFSLSVEVFPKMP